MKNAMRLLVLMAALSSANASAVLADDFTANNAAAAAATNTALQTTTVITTVEGSQVLVKDVKSSSQSNNSFTYNSLPGFTVLPNGAGAQADLDPIAVVPFLQGMNFKQLPDNTGHGVEEKMSGVKTSFTGGATDNVVFIRGTEPGGGVFIDSDVLTVDGDNTSVVMFAATKRALSLGANRVYFTGHREIETVNSAASISAGGFFEIIGKCIGVPLGLSKGKSKMVVKRTILSCIFYHVDLTPTIVPAPIEKKVCNADTILARIAKLQAEIDRCTSFCFFNLTHRDPMIEALIELYQCSGYDERILRDGVKIDGRLIEGLDFQIRLARLNYERGHDIKANQQAADKVMANANFFYSGYLKIVKGKEFAKSWGLAHGVEAVPSLSPDIK